jgi:hypothetical protein
VSDVGAQVPGGNGSSADDLSIELARLDGELEIARRRLYAVENGLETVVDVAAEAAARRTVYDRLGDRFRETYRRWQAAARAEGSESAS